MRNNIIFLSFVMIFFLLCPCYGISQQTNTCETAQLLTGQWSVEKANDWYAKQAWIVGCNFLPSTAINSVEMWQDETFDLPTIDKELGWAADWGMNSVRVFLNYVVWEAGAKKLKSNFRKFLDVAEKHGISVMPVLFDDCNFSGNIAKVGKQQDPVPGVHNSGWVSSPPLAMIRDEAQWEKLKAYEQDIIKTFRNDKRIIIWDLYNEPGNGNSEIKPQLVQNIFAWAREIKPAQPLTIGAWLNFDNELSQLFRSSSDIVSFHAYDGKDGVKKKIDWSRKTGRPVVCTEWLNRGGGNTPQIILPLFKSYQIGGYNWGLVAGRTQTYFPGGSQKGAPEPKIWQHDFIHRDGTPHIPAERETFRTAVLLPGQETSAGDSLILLLLSRLNLDFPGLEHVKAAAGEPDVAMNELLTYFRNGGAGKHPLDKNTKNSLLGNCASEHDMEVAGNALKHIFIGQGAYPPYFCGEDIDWSTSPVPDNEWVWQFNRMYFWYSMGKAYWHTGDEKYARAWAEQLMDWVRKNPNDEAHHYAWRTLEAGIRGCHWMELFQRFVDSPSFTPEVLTVFLNSCYDHASYLMTKFTSRSNWGLMETEGMMYIAVIFPQFKDSETWKTEAIRRFNAETTVQVYPDGMQYELSLGYHTGCAGLFLSIYKFAQLNGIENAFPDSYLRTVEKMFEAVMKISLPDGTHAPFGDDWAGTPGQHKQNFLEWAEFFGRQDFLYYATDGEKGVRPAQTAFALPESGFYSMRSSWDKNAVCMVLKCGPDGGWHCQPDNGTFDLYAGGRNLMPDGGSYIYFGDPENRNWFRQTKVHKTLTLNDKNSRYAPRLVQWSPGEDRDILVIENDSYENLTHRRTVSFIDKKYFVIVDEAIGTATGQIGIHFQLAPGNAVFNEKDCSVRSDFEDGWNVMIRTKPQKGLKLIKEEGQVSFQYAKKEPRPAFVFQMDKPTEESVSFVTVVIPYDDPKTLNEISECY